MNKIMTKLQGPVPQIMGILNVTPDSFSDGGKFTSPDCVLNQINDMLAHGVDIIDVGGESTRPGAQAVSVEAELDRVIPVIKAIREITDIPVSVDTSKPAVMQAAIEAGADIINDVRALQEDGAVEMAAKLDVPVCLMHMQGQPRTMQENPQYNDVTSDVMSFFEERIDACSNAGISRDKIMLDPGFGFGKTLEHNYRLLSELDLFQELNLPILVGMSRKSMIGNLLNVDTHERLAGSLACAVIAAQKGAKVIRVHDVKETVEAIKIWKATQFGVFGE